MAKKQETKLDVLAGIEGFDDSFDMLMAYSTDSVVPGICTEYNCDYSVGVEPDQRAGYCEACGKNSVVSCMILSSIL